MPEQVVVCIELGRRRLMARLRSGVTGLLVGTREQDQPVQFLNAATLGYKFARQIIEQLRMGRTLAVNSEIVRRADNAAAKVVMPYPVHHDTRGQRVSCVSNPVGEFNATLLFGRIGV